MKLKFKGLFLTLVLTVFMVCQTTTVLAATVTGITGDLSQDALDYIGENYEGSGWNAISKYFSTTSNNGQTSSIRIQTDGGIVTMYYHASDVDKIEQKVSNRNATQNSTEDLEDITDGLGIGADTDTATEILSGITPIISTFIGILVILITLGMMIFTGLDACYIVFPVLRNKMEDSKNSGGAMAKKNSDGSTSLRFITDEAQFAVQQVATDPSSNAIATYFKKRVWSYILIAVLLFIFMTGNITLITDLALKVVSGLLNVIQSIG